MTKRFNAQLEAELLEMAHDFRGSVLSDETAVKITMRAVLARRMEELDADTLAAIAAAEVPPEYAHLDEIDICGAMADAASGNVLTRAEPKASMGDRFLDLEVSERERGCRLRSEIVEAMRGLHKSAP